MSEETFDSFCRREYPDVYRAAYVFCGDEDVALDATQEAFSRAYARWKRLSKEPWAGGWVMTTTLNLCKRAFKKRTGSEMPPEVTPMVDVDLHVDVVEALRALPLRQRQAILLYYFADLPVAAVAHLMSASEGTVKSHLSRARDALSHTLKPTDAGADL